MASDRSASNSIRRRLRRSAEAFAEHVLETANDAACLYPLKGIYYFLTRPGLLQPFFSAALTAVIAAAIIVVLICFFGYLPQAAILTVFLGPLGFLVAIAAVVGESWLLVKLFVGSFLIKGMIGEKVFKATLQQRSKSSILDLKSGIGGHLNLADRATKAAQSFQPIAIAQYILTLSLAFVPFIGWPLFIYLNAAKTAKSYVSPYLKRGRGLTTNAARQRIEDEHEAEFNSFGAVALLLEQVPIIGAFFQITNFVGAALWVENLDAKRELEELRS